eukprot:2979655-Rhodomonas_salina.1
MVGSSVVNSASSKQQGPRSSIQVWLSFVAQSSSALPQGGHWEVVLKASMKQPLHVPEHQQSPFSPQAVLPITGPHLVLSCIHSQLGASDPGLATGFASVTPQLRVRLHPQPTQGLWPPSFPSTATTATSGSLIPCILISTSPQLGLKLLRPPPTWGLGPPPQHQPLPKKPGGTCSGYRDRDRGRGRGRGRDRDRVRQRQTLNRDSDKDSNRDRDKDRGRDSNSGSNQDRGRGRDKRQRL